MTYNDCGDLSVAMATFYCLLLMLNAYMTHQIRTRHERIASVMASGSFDFHTTIQERHQFRAEGSSVEFTEETVTSFDHS